MPDHLNAEPDPLAAALAKLRPAPAAAEKPAFLYRAGQASRDAAVRRWKRLAALALAALVVSWAGGVAHVAEADRQLAVAEARVQELTTAMRARPPVESSMVLPESPPFAVPEVPLSRPADPYFDPDPTPQELADALRHRNDILIGGLTMLPKPTPPDTAPHRILPGGVFTTPRHEPGKLPPVFPDDENE